MGFILFGTLCVLFGIIFFIAFDVNTSQILGLFLCTIGGGLFMTGVYEDSMNGPTAMDVYKGKTTLQIIYKDSIPVDSVVVFKEKE